VGTSEVVAEINLLYEKNDKSVSSKKNWTAQFNSIYGASGY
jgi:hypothetical protein